MATGFTFRYGQTVIFVVLILAAVAAFFTLPFQMPLNAAGDLGQTNVRRAGVLPNYDIRSDKTAAEKLAAFRGNSNKGVQETRDMKEAMARGEQALKRRVPTLKVEYDSELGNPQTIAFDVSHGKSFLTGPSNLKRSDILKEFLNQNNELVGARGSQIDDLKVAADYTNPRGNLSFVELNQEIDGVPVFRGEVKAAFVKSGEMVRVINSLAPGLDQASLSTNFGDPLDAVKAAGGLINNDSPPHLEKNIDGSTELKAVFGRGDSATTAEKIYFPTELGVAVPAWRVLIWEPVNAYYVIIDAETGAMLWRKNITEDQTQPATYSVYANPNAMINVAHSPFPFSPGPASPNGAQGVGISRTAITRIGNETPYIFNNLGWIADRGTKTDGNAVQAGLDRDGTDGVDPNGEAVSATRDFTFAYNPLDPNTNTGDAPVPVSQTYPGSAFQQGSITQLFYVCNWFHDETYRLGFTEAARNFQNINFTGQGFGGDRVRAEGQDSLNVNNANFATPADGVRPRMQMYTWTGPNPGIDGNLDADVVIHEHTHGLSNRLIGNGSGLTHDMARGMGEGWSDFYGMALLSQPSDPIDGIYTTGSYDTFRLGGSFLNNAYYGIRRFPMAIKSSVGGPNGRPHNPLTFADIDSSQMNLSDGAYSPRYSGTSDQVHNAGEIWCSALWEIRARMITRLGWSEGNRRILQFVTDGMKLSPLSPTFLSGRDAIIAAAIASGTSADVADMWAGFATRGLGAGAGIQNVGGTSIGGTGTARVTEGFDLPNLYQSPNLTISDAAGNNNGFPEPGETVALTIPLTNSTGNTATGITLQVVGGGSADYGNLVSGLMTSRVVNYIVPAGTACGSVVTLTLNINSSLGPASFTRTFAVGNPNTSFTENFDGTAPPAIAAGWSVASSYPPMTFVSTTSGPDTAPNSMFAADPQNVGGSTELISPFIFVSSGTTGATVSFRHRYNTEPGFDGGVLEISIGGSSAPFVDIVAAGGTFLQNGYNATLGVSSPNPLGGRAAWTGESVDYATTIARMPPSAAGQPVKLRWRFGADNNTAPVGGGWNIDSIRVTGNYFCFSGSANQPRADFDGDGRTDLSVYRPSQGNWYLDRSTQGLSAINFGISEDVPTPGDFDGDRKADIAVWRPSSGIWYRVNSGNGSVFSTNFGMSGDIPQAGDFDGDGKDDIAVFRPSNGTWYWQNSGNGQFGGAQFGQNGDLPVAGDYDGDGKDDIAVFRAATGTWFRLNTGNGQPFTFNFGLNGDMPVHADYDGDNREDIAVFRPSEGNWYWQNSGNGQFGGVHFGQNGDIPVPGDYDGDGRDDQAVYRGGIWYLNRSTLGSFDVNFGLGGDTPILKKYIP